ncbi:hypothetical protein [Cellulosimicrobium cellulans]
MDAKATRAEVIEDLASDPDNTTVNQLASAAAEYGFDPLAVLDQALTA